ncbi:hypothetical protein RSAG8_07752, partial [Rhizoctonia solani AG-8 WAC10335]
MTAPLLTKSYDNRPVSEIPCAATVPEAPRPGRPPLTAPVLYTP